MQYNTREIRRAASRIRQCAEELSSSTAPVLKKIQQEIPEFFDGDAADALGVRLQSEAEIAKSMCSALYNLSSALLSLAIKLEEADERISKMMQ